MSQMRSPHHPKSMFKAMSARWRRHMLVADTRRKVIKLALVFTLVGGVIGAVTQPALWQEVGSLRDDVMVQLKSRPELLIHDIEITGGSEILKAEVVQELNLDFPISRLDVDLDAIAAKAKEFSAVHDAAVRITPEGVMTLVLSERNPAFVWLSRDGYFVIDQEGETLGTIEARKDMPHLPLLVDDGAPSAVFEAQMILDRVAQVGDDIKGLRRVGERRWNILLSQGRQVYLPADDPAPAVDAFLTMAQSDDLLARDFVHLDLRLAHRHTVRAREVQGEQLVNGQAQVE